MSCLDENDRGNRRSDQVDRYDVVQQGWHDQSQDAGNPLNRLDGPACDHGQNASRRPR